MFHRMFRALAVVGAIAVTGANAATVDIAVTGSDNAPAAFAVVGLVPDDAAAVIASHAPEASVIDQRHEMFLPRVVVIRRGGRVVFTNNDVTMHQVYSFSPIRQFQFEIDEGQVSRPVVFDEPGVAAIGCNIHDDMVAYVYVADEPFAAITDERGHAEIPDVPAGHYLAKVWHPQLRIGHAPPPSLLTVKGERVDLSLSIPLARAPAMSRMHKSDY